MRTWKACVITAVAVSALTAAASQVLQAQGKPPVYLVAITTDEMGSAADINAYRDRAGAQLDKHGGKFIIRGSNIVANIMGTPPKRIVVARFADAEAAKKWQDDPVSKQIAADREKLIKGSFVLIEGMN